MKGASFSREDGPAPSDSHATTGSGEACPVAVAVINSPMHVWQIREACAHWGVPPQNVWVAVFQQASVNSETLERTLDEIGDWGRVIWLAMTPSLRTGVLGLASVLRRERHRVDWQRHLAGARGSRLVMTALNRVPVNRQVAAWLRGGELIWLDDGTMTPTLVRKDSGREAAGREKPGENAWKGSTGRHRITDSVRSLVKGIPGSIWLWRRIRRRGVGLVSAADSWLQRRRGVPPVTARTMEIDTAALKLAYPRAQTYFTVAEVWPLPPARWEPNRLNWLRGRLEGESSDTNEMHFLGAPLVDRDGVPFADYIDWLRRVHQDSYGAPRMVYVPHPWESEEFLGRVAEELDIEIRSFGLPYEIALATMQRRPAAVASWFCSALEHLEAVDMRDLQLVAYRVPPFESTLSIKREANQAAIFRAADAFYRRHASGSGIDVRPVPGMQSQFVAESGQDAVSPNGTVSVDAR